MAIPSGRCAVPANAAAYSLNIAVLPIPAGNQMRWLTAWGAGSTQPTAATLNDKAGLVTSNSGVVPAGTSGSIDVFVTDPTNVIIDINGYYAPPSTLPLTGTAAAPALTFGDTSTGIYSDSAGTVSIATGGVNPLTVDSNGDFGLAREHPKIRRTVFAQFGPVQYSARQGVLPNGTGILNTAAGQGALTANTTGGGNTAMGYAAVFNNTTGWNNTGIGADALTGVTTGSSNTALGSQAGFNIKTYIAGIRGVTTGNGDAIAVVIDSNGQLGTVSSPGRVKRDIRAMSDATETIMKLHPVEFRYTAHGSDSPLLRPHRGGSRRDSAGSGRPQRGRRDRDGLLRQG